MSILFSNYLLPAFPNAAPSGPPASTYVGPGDVVSGWQVWWGLRGFSNAVAATGTQKAINVRRASDSTTTDILILTNGKLDTATLAAFQVVDATGTGAITGTALTFTGGHIGDVVTGGTTLPGTIIVSGSSPAWTVNLSQTVVSTTLTLTWGMFITKFYDQSGAGSTFDAAQATAAKQPQILLTGGPSGGVSAKFVGSASQGLPTTGTVSATTGSVSVVAERTGTFTSVNCVVSAGGIFWSTGFFNTTNTAFAFAGISGSAVASDSVWHAIQYLFNGNGATTGIVVDGSLTLTNFSTNNLSSIVGIGLNTGGANFLTGNFVEGGITTNNFTPTTQAAINANQHGSNGWNF